MVSQRRRNWPKVTARRAGVTVVGAVLAVNLAAFNLSQLSWRLRDPRLVGLLLLIDAVALVVGLWLVADRPPMSGATMTGLTLVLGIVGGEFTARFLPAFRPSPRTLIGAAKNPDRPSTFIADSAIGWRMRPDSCWEWVRGGAADSYCSDKAGFRVPGDPAFPEGAAAIVFIGDSFTFGTGVSAESTFAMLVGRALPGARVWNLGLPGFGVDQMLMVLRAVALRLEPKLIVVSFIDQDFERSLTAYRSREGFAKPMLALEGDTVRLATASDRPPALFWWLSQRSWLWRAGELATQRAGYRYDVGRWWRLNAAALRTMHRDATTQGIPLLFARLPKKDESTPWPSLHRMMATAGAPFLDLVDSSRGVPGLHFGNDPHIDEDGHRFVAEAILQWVRQDPRLTALTATHPGSGSPSR